MVPRWTPFRQKFWRRATPAAHISQTSREAWISLLTVFVFIYVGYSKQNSALTKETETHTHSPVTPVFLLPLIQQDVEISGTLKEAQVARR